jgi:isopropylmalate/homocitrate/citramalate synthase
MIEIVEVGPRDGLQAAAAVLAPARRAELIDRLGRTGIGRAEAVSFVRPDVVPQMDGAEEVVSLLDREPGLSPIALVVNARGYERAVAAGLDEVRFAFTISDEFNRRNSGVDSAQGLRAALDLIARGIADGVGVGVVLGTSFGCPFEGEIAADDVLAAFARTAEAGAAEIVFADTVGVGVPSQVREFARAAAGQGVRFGFHFHNTRNTGYANAWEAAQEGAELLDASVGGLGGCPFAPEASGNIATEDLVYMLGRAGIETGVDVGALIEISRWLESSTELELDGLVHKVPWFPTGDRAGTY